MLSHLALQFGGESEDDFIIASDASFADNTVDRRSSQAYIMQLFGGVIGWRANKQDTVTTSTTEAELLALSQAIKEAMFISRLIRELDIKLSTSVIKIQCDNRQTISLVHKDIQTLKTKLRHVDIHNHWLRERAERGEIVVEYTPTNDMIADGLTKALPAQKHQLFVAQMKLIDISARVSERILPVLTSADFDEVESMIGD